jgi:hypothetical protein
MASSDRAPFALWLATIAITNVFVAYVAFGLGKGLMHTELGRVRAERDGLQHSLTQCLAKE